ncbi:MAG: OmpA family protein [Phycisphaerales bacterium]|nr:OmpA family protein [Phycisphaerales bacterium]
MTKIRFFVALIALGSIMLCSGCNNKLKEQNDLLNEEVLNVRAELADRNSALEEARNELRDRDRELARLRTERDDAMRAQPVAPTSAPNPFSGIDGVTGSYSAGLVTATVEADVLFDSGQATIKNAAKSSLNAVANVLNSTYGGREIQIVGYTDTDPIKKTKDKYRTNYHLGFERAFAVREYLISRGVSGSRVTIGSRGPDKPMGSKAKSRRVEINVVVGD